MIHHKATLESDQQTTLVMLTSIDNAFITNTIKRDNNKHDIISSLGTVDFLLGTIFNLAVTKFVVIMSFLHNRTKADAEYASIDASIQNLGAIMISK